MMYSTLRTLSLAAVLSLGGVLTVPAQTLTAGHVQDEADAREVVSADSSAQDTNLFLDTVPVPEPTAVAMLLGGTLLIAMRRRTRR